MLNEAVVTLAEGVAIRGNIDKVWFLELIIP